MESAKLKMMEEIEKQRLQLRSSNDNFRLLRPCTVGDGILPVTFLEQFSQKNDVDAGKIGFFIPASGSGSRMFAFLEKFLNSGIEDDLSSLFFRKYGSFAFTDKSQIAESRSLSLNEKKEIARRLLHQDPFNFADKPKGLIPFFELEGQQFTPFMMHVIQSKELLGVDPYIHFTVQQKYASEIREHLAEHFPLDIRNVHFSHQDPRTDAFCFDETFNSVFRDGEPLRRPSGHGALLSNLNSVEREVVLIKNVDNLQFGEDEHTSTRVWKQLIALLERFKSELYAVCLARDVDGLRELNTRYHFLNTVSDTSFEEEGEQLLSKPIRICGMVKNEGKPGGGPFWINSNGEISKQIVELSQISKDQSEIAEMSTHFNPVFMICALTDANNQRIDLLKYTNDDFYLKVQKTEGPMQIQYCELPGLWNGSMHNWTTLFVEIPGTVFTPVKTALDLI